MPADGFVAFAHANCSSQEQGLKAAIWAFDAKNKVSRKQSEEDANLQIEDYVLTAEDKYRARAPKPAAAASPQGRAAAKRWFFCQPGELVFDGAQRFPGGTFRLGAAFCPLAGRQEA